MPGGSESWRIGSHGSSGTYSNSFEIKPAAAGNDFYISNNSGTPILYSDTSTSNIGIGTASPAAKLDIVDSQTQSGSGTATIKSTATTTTTSTQSSGMYAIQNYFNLTGTGGSFQNAAHQQVLTTVSSTGTGTNLKNHVSRVHTSGSGEISNVAHYNIHTELGGNGTINKWMGYAVADGTLATFENTGHTITDTYGLYIGDITSGTQTNTPYGVYQASTDMENYFGGNVGIGTTNPSSLLHLEAAASPALQIKDTTNNVTFKAYAQDSNSHLANTSNHDLFIDTNNTPRITVKADGKVGIGTTSPSDKLHIEQDGGTVAIGSPTTSYGGIGFEDAALTTANSALYGVASQTVIGVKAGGAIEMKIANNSSIGLLKMETNKLHYTNGSVGIGLTNPAGDKLMVKGDDGYFASRLDGSTTAGQSMGLRVRAGYNSTDRPVLIEQADGSDVFMIDGLGNVGIGSSPSYKLDVNGTTRSTYYIGGAYLEENASSSKLKLYPDGTVLVIDEDGELKPCDKENDTLVFGVSKIDFDSPVVLGAEPILVTGPIKVGDYIVTSSKQGHGQAMKEQKLGTIIAQAMENGDGESYNIKAMIRKM